MSNSKKTVALSQEFLRAAAGIEVNALAYQLLAAFGVSLASCVEMVKKAILAKDVNIIVLMLASAVQIRGNVVFVGREYAGIRAAYPGLVIEGSRDVLDQFNFGALHVCGHVLACITTSDIGVKILNKAGNCALGGGFTENDAGKINAEIYKSWVRLDVDAFNTWLTNKRTEAAGILDPIVDQIPALSAVFAAKLAPPPVVKAGAATTSS